MPACSFHQLPCRADGRRYRVGRELTRHEAGHESEGPEDQGLLVIGPMETERGEEGEEGEGDVRHEGVEAVVELDRVVDAEHENDHGSDHALYVRVDLDTETGEDADDTGDEAEPHRLLSAEDLGNASHGRVPS